MASMKVMRGRVAGLEGDAAVKGRDVLLFR
jgi:hypothetical protein